MSKRTAARLVPGPPVGHLSRISATFGQPAGQAYEVAVLRKVKEQTEVQGEATLDLLASASPSARPPDGTGTIIDDVA